MQDGTMNHRQQLDRNAEPSFSEENRRPLSDRERDRLLELLASPPAANHALRAAVRGWNDEAADRTSG